MSLLNTQSPSVTLNFSLPPEFQPPFDGDNETIVSVKAINSKSVVTVDEWRRPRFFDSGWKFQFLHPYDDIGVRYQINVQMFHNQQPLLVEQDYFVIVNQTPHRQTIHLSPIGLLYVEVQQPDTFAAEEAVTVSLHEVADPSVELIRVMHDEQTASSFYLKYDPQKITPGKRYALTGIESRYHQQITVSPGHVELAPVSPGQPGRLAQKLSQWAQAPLRLFTDATAKIR